MNVPSHLNPLVPSDGPSSGARSGTVSSRPLEGVPDLIADVVLVLRPDGTLVDANEGALSMYGYRRDEIVGLNIASLRPEDTRDDIAAQLAQANAHGISFEARHVTKEGRVIDVEIRSQGSDTAGGRLLVSVIRDVTKDRRTIDYLRRSEGNLRAVLENCPEPIALVLGVHFSYVNAAFLTLLRYPSSADLLGKSIFDVTHPHEHDAMRARIAGAPPESTAFRAERRLLRSDGTLAMVGVTAVALVVDDEPSTLLYIRDLTDRKTLESQLAIADRMTSIGTLAAGVAHEINNPLAYVTNNVEFANSELQAILGQLDAESPLRARLAEVAQALREAELGADRVRQIVLDLKTFSRIDDQKRHPVDVRKALELAISMATNEIRHRARLVFSPEPTGRVDANEAKLGQVFLNVLINAAQAIPEGRADSHVIRVGLGTDERRRVVVTVTDDGEGIAEEIRERVFDPFFTTKPQGIGTGLGLAICHNIVRSLGGDIGIESEVGVGTTVRITLPQTTSALQPADTGKHSLMPRPSRARVVLVDDEPMIGAAVRRILTKDHDVLLLTSAREARDRIAAGERFDVILCDLMMPEMTGMDLYEALRKVAPDQAERMRFVTGGTFTERARSFVDERPDRVIQKPFRATQLRKLIAEMFEAPAP